MNQMCLHYIHLKLCHRVYWERNGSSTHFGLWSYVGSVRLTLMLPWHHTRRVATGASSFHWTLLEV